MVMMMMVDLMAQRSVTSRARPVQSVKPFQSSDRLCKVFLDTMVIGCDYYVCIYSNRKCVFRIQNISFSLKELDS